MITNNASYQKFLIEGESIKAILKYSKKGIYFYLALIAMCYLFVVIFSNFDIAAITFGLIVALPFLLYVLSLRFQYVTLITNKRVIASEGILGVKVTSVDHDKITDISVVQDPLNRIFNAGNVVINTAGSSDSEIVMHSVDFPYEIKNLIHAQTEQKS